MKIAAVFSTEANVDDVLNKLYSEDIDSDDVTLIRDNGERGDGMVESSEGSPVPTPTVVPATTSGNAVPAVSAPLFADFSANIDDEMEQHYERIVDRGGAVVIVDIEDDQKSNFVNFFEKHSANRVDVLN